MPHFLVIGFDHPPHSMPLRDGARAEHRDYVLANDGDIRLAGAMLDDTGNQCGSIYAFEADSEEALRSWLKAEPFCGAGVYETIRIVKWHLALNRFDRKEWKTR